MKINDDMEQIIKEYEKKKNELEEYDSYINHVKGYNGYIFKEMREINKCNNEIYWLKKLREFNYCSPKFIGTYDNVIITEKIDAVPIKDEEAKEHLYNIGKLIAKLHNLPIETSNIWGESLMKEFVELKKTAKDVIEEDLYKSITHLLEQGIKDIIVSKNVVIHKDIRPENILHKSGKYYLLDFESMCVGDRDYDFIRMFNIFNEKEVYQYEDFKNFMDGYNSINKIHFDEKKWNLYSKYYAFRMYTRILSGKIDRNTKFEEYLQSILENKNDRITKWIKKYNGGDVLGERYYK